MARRWKNGGAAGKPAAAIGKGANLGFEAKLWGAEEVEDDGEPFETKMKRLTTTLGEQFAESHKLEKAIRKNLEGLGYGLEGER